MNFMLTLLLLLLTSSTRQNETLRRSYMRLYKRKYSIRSHINCVNVATNSDVDVVVKSSSSRSGEEESKKLKNWSICEQCDEDDERIHFSFQTVVDSRERRNISVFE